MKLYIGGAYQGQNELAQRENSASQVWTDFHETIREAVHAGEDPCAFAERFCREHPGAVVAANEVGAGVVPIAAGTMMAIMEAYVRPWGRYYDFQVKNGRGYILFADGAYSEL